MKKTLYIGRKSPGRKKRMPGARNTPGHASFSIKEVCVLYDRPPAWLWYFVVVFLGKGERVPLSEPYYSLIFPVNQPLFYRFVKLCKRKFLSRKNVTFPISKNFFMLCKCHIFILELIFALFLCILHKKYTIYYSCFLIISSYFLYVHSGSLS